MCLPIKRVRLSATRFYASSMQLQVQSDASYLCRPKARSVLGGHHYLGFPDRINGPIFCTSKIISCVVASVAEAELGAAFQNAQKAAEFWNTLHEIGYPQNPTTIMIDNTIAEGLAAYMINARRSKSMDVRFFWLRDRIQHPTWPIQSPAPCRSMEHIRLLRQVSSKGQVHAVLRILSGQSRP